MFVKLPFWPYHKPLNILLHKLRLSMTLVSVELGAIQKIKNYFKHLDKRRKWNTDMTQSYGIILQINIACGVKTREAKTSQCFDTEQLLHLNWFCQ